MYFWSVIETVGADSRLPTRIAAIATYTRLRPSVYSNPVSSAARGFSTRRLMNEIAATLVASGQGLMAVRMPAQAAAAIAAHSSAVTATTPGTRGSAPRHSP